MESKILAIHCILAPESGLSLTMRITQGTVTFGAFASLGGYTGITIKNFEEEDGGNKIKSTGPKFYIKEINVVLDDLKPVVRIDVSQNQQEPSTITIFVELTEEIAKTNLLEKM